MKTKYRIGIFILLFTFIYLFINLTYTEYNSKKNNSVESDLSVTVSEQTINNNGYYLYELNGYIVVFMSDKKTPYEYTNIIYEELPELLKKEIRNGKYLKDKEELYGFLENYTS